MFTVLIPAFNRPELLNTALHSVAAQTALGLVDRVVVSENGQNRGSEQVCQEFPDLNIEYHFHEHRLPVMQHLAWVLSQVPSGYAAMLCDDDWWDAHHLEMAQKSLAQYPDGVAYFGNYTHAHNSSSIYGPGNYWASGMHLGYPNFKNYQVTRYEAANVLLLCLLFTPFHFSGMVSSGSVLKEAVKIYSETHAAVADRILWAKVATYGPILFNPLPTAVILRHEKQDSHNYTNNWQTELQKGAAQVFEFAKQLDIDLPAYLNSVYSNASPADASFIRENLQVNFYQPQALAWFDDVAAVAEMQLLRSLAPSPPSLPRQLINFARKSLKIVFRLDNQSAA